MTRAQYVPVYLTAADRFLRAGQSLREFFRDLGDFWSWLGGKSDD